MIEGPLPRTDRPRRCGAWVKVGNVLCRCEVAVQLSDDHAGLHFATYGGVKISWPTTWRKED